MSVIAKCFLVVFAVLCCMQLAEMARLPRADSPPTSDFNIDDLSKKLNELTQSFMQSVQGLSENEKLKELGKNVEGIVREGLNKMSEGASDLTNKLKTTN